MPLPKNKIKAVFFGLLFTLPVLFSSCATSDPALGRKRDYLFPVVAEKNFYHSLYDQTLQLFEPCPSETNVETRFGTAHLLTMGDPANPPLFLLHGMDASSTMWYPNMASWSDTHYVIAVDHIMDCGKSVLKTGPLTKQETVLFYCDILDRLKYKKASFLGTSRGGWIACHLGIQMQERVDKLVLMSPAQTFCMADFKIVNALNFKMFPSRKNLAKTLKTFAWSPEKIDTAYKKQFLYASQQGRSQAQIFQMLPFSKKQLRSLKIPVLYMVGQRDIMNSEKGVKKASENVQGIQIVRIPESGHFMSTDRSELVNGIVSDFLNGKPVDSSLTQIP